jgi:hypothetical protein
MRVWRALLLLALAGQAVAESADDVRVISARADDVSVTLYRDLFALVTETRDVDLPEGPVTLVLEGVTDTLLAQSAVITGTGRAIAETNHDFDRITPASLLRESIGKSVMLTRTNPATGRVRQVSATLVAANPAGVLFRTDEGNEALHCSGLPEQLSLDSVPETLNGKPSLSIRLAAGTPGKRQIRVSYLAHGFSWSADYLGALAPAADRMELDGWITLENLTGASFHDAQIQLVAGRLNLLDEEEGGTSLVGDTAGYSTDDGLAGVREETLADMRDDLDEPPFAEHFRGCYPLGPPHFSTEMIDTISAQDIGRFPDANLAEALQRVGGEDIDEIIVTGFRSSMALRENLADYQLYRLPVKTDLLARQRKQVAFLHKPNVHVDRFYGVRLATDEEALSEIAEAGDAIPASVKIGWHNSAASGLGEPLPGGVVRFFETAGGHSVFIGDADFRDTPLDTPIEIEIGRATGVHVAIANPAAEPETGPLTLLTRRVYLPIDLRLMNSLPRPVVLEIRQGPIEQFLDFRVKGSRLKPTRKFGDYAWRLTVPANGEAALSYAVGGKIDLDTL